MAAANKRTFQVLYVENDSRQAETFTAAFGNLVTISVKADPQEALRYLEANHLIDLVIFNDQLDSQLFFRKIQSKVYLQELQVILISTQSEIDLKNRPFGDHVIDIFPPDYSIENLRTRLSYLVKKRDYEQSVGHPNKGAPIWMPVGKRVFDLAVSVTVLLFLSPLLIIVAILIKLDSKGPIFYSSKRVGTGYKIFDMYKFRTMRTDADKMLSSMASKNMYNKETARVGLSDGRCDVCRANQTACQRPLFLDDKQVCEKLYQQQKREKAMFMKFKEDPRVTRLGKFLRNTSIDELPQLFNILKGDMSFVGNRPLPPYEAEKLTASGYARRFAAPAGLTGLWQVTKRGTRKVSDQERIQLDILYAKTYSLRTDLIILLKTVKAVWQKENV
ncbi:hypothetical protein GCM10023187_33420 [Nibrella viscosa]|uniref:Bacterial sugar transferase domain-containing protein n=1 Tax=Nibrella viscosa TaxID=1084524 RepID=A0ABP8KLR3_9BACT